MEAQIKEETKEASLCFENSCDNINSLSLVEKYDQYIQNEGSDIDSDGDFFPDDTVLREEYAQLTSDAQSNYPRTLHHCLSNGLPGKFRKYDIIRLPTSGDDAGNGTISAEDTSDASDSERGQEYESAMANLDDLIDKLEEVRKCEPEGNSVFCTDDDLEAIQQRYGAILDFMHERSTTFERKPSSKDSDNEEQVDVGNACSNDQREDTDLLAEKIVSVQQARDKFYEIEQQVREQIEQLELVERYKMESVG